MSGTNLITTTNVWRSSNVWWCGLDFQTNKQPAFDKHQTFLSVLSKQTQIKMNERLPSPDLGSYQMKLDKYPYVVQCVCDAGTPYTSFIELLNLLFDKSVQENIRQLPNTLHHTYIEGQIFVRFDVWKFTDNEWKMELVSAE